MVHIMVFEIIHSAEEFVYTLLELSPVIPEGIALNFFIYDTVYPFSLCILRSDNIPADKYPIRGQSLMHPAQKDEPVIPWNMEEAEGGHDDIILLYWSGIPDILL